MMTKGNSQILSGFCPNPHCQKKLFFPEHEASVECSGCGQRHVQSSLQSLEKNLKHPGLMEVVENLLVHLMGMDEDRKKTIEQENYKINGLSNYLCTILSPLLTTHGMDKNSGRAKLLTEMGKAPVFDCGQLCDRSFLIEPAHLNVSGFGRDRSGSSDYLRDTLNVIKLSNDNEERLVPIHADGDGHCLLHSVSRALVGWELFWHPLRVNLKQHFIQNLSKYKMQFHDFVDESEWEMIVEECDPDFSPSGSEPTGLRNIHIFGLANVLRRPIILLDSMEGIQSSGDYSAIFLPIFSTPAACKNKDGALNTPLCIAWSSLGRNHFIPLVGVKGKKCPVLSRHMIQRAWGVSDVEIDNYVHFENGHCRIGGEKGLQIGYVQRLVSAMNDVFLQQHSVCASLVADVYQHIFKANGLVFGVNLAVLLEKTKSSTEAKQLFLCLACRNLAFSQPLEDNAWCMPGGELYKLAVSCHGALKDGQSYSFPIHDVIAKYDKGRDRLVPVDGSRKPSHCLYCTRQEFRLVKPDYTVMYQNGDRTLTKSSVCSCGFKHFWNGHEYDTTPKQVLVLMEWGGRTVKAIVPWFQNEPDPSLNSNVYQMAQDLVQKRFPGEFGSERLVQKVVDQILYQTDNPTKLEELKSLDQNHHNETSLAGGDTSLTWTQSTNTVQGATKGNVQMEATQDEVSGASGAWSAHLPSKAIITGRQTQSIHKEELNMSNAERRTKQRIEKNAAVNQRKSSGQQNLNPNKKTSSNQKSTDTKPLPLDTKSTTTTTPTPSTPPSSSASTSATTTTATTTTKPSTANLANKRIRLVTSDGRNLTLDLPAQCTFQELQSLVHKTVGVPPERQKMRHGFPPVELKAPLEAEPNSRLPVQPGDRIMLDILEDTPPSGGMTNTMTTTTTPAAAPAHEDDGIIMGGLNPHKSAWNSFASSLSPSDGENEASDLLLKSLMDPLMNSAGGDNLDRSVTALTLTAALDHKELWTYVQRMPHLFSVNGLFYKQMERDMGLEHGRHCTLAAFSHKMFVYNAQDDRLEICLEPYGHFAIEPKVETKALTFMPTSYCRSRGSHTPFSGQGHSLRSVSSQEDRMPTDVPMSPKRMEARRLNTLCDPSIHQESIEEEDEEGGDDSAMKTDDHNQNGAASVSSHLLRPEELTRHSPSKTGAASTLHMPGPESKLIRRGPGYSELSPIPENSSNEKSEMLHQLVERIEQAVKSMGQDDYKVGEVQDIFSPWPSTAPSTSGPVPTDNGNGSHNIPSPDAASSSNNGHPFPSRLPAFMSISSSVPVHDESNAAVQPNGIASETMKTWTASSSSSPPPPPPSSSSPTHTVSFPSPSAILLSSSIMAGVSSRSDSERNSSSSSSRRGSDNDKDNLMAGEKLEFPEMDSDNGSDCPQSQSSSASPFREENPMDVGDGQRSRVAVYAQEMASSLMTMDDDFNVADTSSASGDGERRGDGGGALGDEDGGCGGGDGGGVVQICDNGVDANTATNGAEEEEMDSASSSA